MGRISFSTAALPWTKLLVATSDQGLAAIQFVHEPDEAEARRRLAAQFPGEDFSESASANRETIEELQAYAAGELKQFTVRLDLRGTPFQLAVWRALLRIPYGETRTYGDMARVIGRPRAFRAVGLANHSNPIPIVVPCHRVIGSSGRLVGYGGGLALKDILLEHEHRHAAPPRAGVSKTLSLWK